MAGLEKTWQTVRKSYDEMTKGSGADRVPSCLYDKGENSCLSGACIEAPCCDVYAPNQSCRFFKPSYNEKTYSYEEFYRDIMPKLHTGDIYLGGYPRSGNKIGAFATHSRWSHVGMIYRRSDCPEILKTKCVSAGEDIYWSDQIHPSRPLIAEVVQYDDQTPGFTLGDFEDGSKMYLGQKMDGPEYADWEPWQVAVRFLTGVTRNTSFYQAIEECVTRNHNDMYKYDINVAIDLCQWMAAYPGCCCLQCERAPPQPGFVFCAEFVADCYQSAGLIDPDLDKAEFLPSMFDTTRALKLLEGAGLSPTEHRVVGIENEEEAVKAGFNQANNTWGTDVTKAVEDVPFSGFGPPAQQDMDTGGYKRMAD